MKTRMTLSAGLLPGFAGIFFVVMTIVFLSVPYSMSRHPGETSQRLSTDEARGVEFVHDAALTVNTH
jgi:type III secretory pathway component EscV